MRFGRGAQKTRHGLMAANVTSLWKIDARWTTCAILKLPKTWLASHLGVHLYPVHPRTSGLRKSCSNSSQIYILRGLVSLEVGLCCHRKNWSIEEKLNVVVVVGLQVYHACWRSVVCVGDTETVCRTYGNLAAMFFVRRCYRLSLRCRHAELFHCISLPSNRRRRLLSALGNLAHALHATGNHSAAILCHRLCAVSSERSADYVAEARELRSIGKNGTAYQLRPGSGPADHHRRRGIKKRWGKLQFSNRQL